MPETTGAKQDRRQWDRVVYYLAIELLLNMWDSEEWPLEPEEKVYIADELKEWLAQRTSDKRRE